MLQCWVQIYSQLYPLDGLTPLSLYNAFVSFYHLLTQSLFCLSHVLHNAIEINDVLNV